MQLTLSDFTALAETGECHLFRMSSIGWHCSATYVSEGLKVEMSGHGPTAEEALAKVLLQHRRLTEQRVIPPAALIEHKPVPSEPSDYVYPF